ncbi:MAG: transposase family protein [Acidimicrobiales bacterium]
MEINPIRMCEHIVGLPSVNVLGIDDEPGGRLIVHIECRGGRPCCGRCNTTAVIKERRLVELVDLPAFGRPTLLVWHKRRFRCPEISCPSSSWTEENRSIASPRLAMTDRAGRWVTKQVGRYARSVNGVARELGCDWHTLNNAVMAYGKALVDDDPLRYSYVAQPSSGWLRT